MSLCPADTTRIRRNLTLAAALLAAASLPSESLRAQTCGAPGDLSPGLPVPECVSASGADLTNGGATPCPSPCAAPECNRLWRQSGLHPASSGQLPPERDSTQFDGRRHPNWFWGTELFLSLDVVTSSGVGERLHMAYNAGIQVWDIATDPVDPERLEFADGWEGHFLFFPVESEKITFIDDISALYDAPTNQDVIAVSGVNPIGPSLWEYDVGAGTYRQLYQDPGTRTRQISLVDVELLGGAKTYFAFAATDDGVAVYNLTRARGLSTPCLDDRGSNAQCDSVYRGLIATSTVPPNSRIFVDALVPASKPDRVFVVTGNGGSRAPELWEVLDPNAPSAVGPGVQLRWAAGSDLTGARGFELFAYKSKHYLALVHQKNVKIFEIDDCLDLSGLAQCSPTAVVSLPVRDDVFSAEEYLSYSTAGGNAYLYYGIGLTGLSGSDVDQLFDVSGIDDPAPQVVRLPQEGSYVEPCNGQPISYWSHTYPRNFHGLREFQPRKGQFAPNGTFYRAGTGVFDIHVIGDGSVPPTITTVITDPVRPPYWMSDQISFAATAAGGCEPSSTDWAWTATPRGSSDVFPALISQPGNLAFYQFDCMSTGGARCEGATFDVTASNSASSCTTAALAPATLTLKDPSLGITSVSPPDGSVFEEGQTLPLSAQLSGRGPVSWKWTVNGLAVPSCDGTNLGDGQDVSALPVACEVAIQDYHTGIFADGFESGNTGAWLAVKSSPRLPVKADELSVVLRVWSGADTSAAPWDIAEISVEVVEAGVDPPVVTSFDIASESLVVPSDPGTAGRPCRFDCVLCAPQEVICKPGQAVLFTVTSDPAAGGYRFDWDGLGSGASFGAVTTSLSHAFAGTPAGPFRPAVKAVSGAGESVTPLELGQQVTIGSF